MLDLIHQIDTQLLVWIHKLHTGFGDALFPFLRQKINWLPLYVFLAVFMVLNFKKRGLWFILFFILTVGMADTISSKVVKYTVKRMRPCHIDEIRPQLEMLIPCGGPYSFTSSHATNHFAIAVFLIMTLGSRFPMIKWPLLVWASLIGLAQVYVGVHYPFDIVGGAILGSVIGWGVAWYFNFRIGLNASSPHP